MNEKMTDRELGRAIWLAVGQPTTDPTEVGRVTVDDFGAAARRLVHEDDLRGVLTKAALVNVVRDLIPACPKCQPPGCACADAVISAFGPYIARLIAERDAAFQAGAEAMREAAAKLVGRDEHDMQYFGGQYTPEYMAAQLRALPLPAHGQSGTGEKA